MFERVAIPKYVGARRSAAAARDAIAAWARSPPLIALVDAWDGSLPPVNSTPGALRWLDDFSATHWDFRRGAERQLLAGASDERDALVVAAAHALGLGGEVVPTRSRYDFLLVLGGLAWACLERPAYA